MPQTIQLMLKDALLIVDVQNDFLPGGKLAVPHGDEVVPVLNRYIELFVEQSLPVFVTRDWHPVGHCSFKERGGPWPVHCIAGSEGASFSPALKLSRYAVVISKAKTVEKDAYSGFEETDLKKQLCSRHVERLFIGGLATDYCVLNTVMDALSLGFKTILLLDAIRAVDVQPGDGQKSIVQMLKHGAQPAQLSDITTPVLRQSGISCAQPPL